jgi:predicted sugar kinase
MNGKRNLKKNKKDELNKLKKYYDVQINQNTDIIKNILIFTKKNVIKDDIKHILYFIRLFKAEETEQITKKLEEINKEFENEENFNFEKLKRANDYLEQKEIYLDDGKTDSALIKFIRDLYGKEAQIDFAKSKDVDSAATLMYKLNPITGQLKFNDIIEYQSCVDFINDIKEKVKDENLFEQVSDKELLEKVKEKLSKDKI